MKLKTVILTAGLGMVLAAPAFAASSTQKAIHTLHTQIEQIEKVQTETIVALKEHDDATQKSIADFQKQVQDQLTILHNQIQQVQEQLTKEIKTVQSEMVKAGAPVVNAAPEDSGAGLGAPVMNATPRDSGAGSGSTTTVPTSDKTSS